MKNNNGVQLTRILTIAGAFTAFLIGSGFATGQEVLQYFSSYGYQGVAGAVLTFSLLTYVGISFLQTGEREKFKRSNDIYKYYCGKHLGIFFDYFSTLFCFLSFIAMIAGAGATLEQHYDWPVFFGGSLIALLALVTVISGLNRVVEIISKIGPVIIVVAITLGLTSVAQNADNLSTEKVMHSLASLASQERLLTASSHWALASFSYVGFCMLWLASFLAAAGAKTHCRKEATMSGLLGAFIFSIAVIVVSLGLLADIEAIAGSQIPMLHLAENIHPILASLFAIIIMAGIYTTSVPLLWNVASRFTQDGSIKFKLFTSGLTFTGSLIGLYLPFDKVVNTVYVMNGYVGIGLMIIMVSKSIKDRLQQKSAPAMEKIQET